MFSYGDAHFHGALSNVNDVIGIAGTAPPLPTALLPFSAHTSGASASLAVPGATPNIRRGELSEAD